MNMMTEYLQQQAAKAERLAKEIMDNRTAEALRAFATECRAQAILVTDRIDSELVGGTRHYSQISTS